MVRGRRSRWLFAVVLLAGIAAFSALWYLDSTRETAGTEPAFGGVYVEGVAGVPARINPLFAGQNEADETLVSLVFAGLTRLDDQGAPFPDLADTWSVGGDGRIFTFRLRPGLLWQDGRPVTADDVLFTYALLRAPDLRAPPPLARVLAGADIARVDGLTLTIALPQPFAPLPSYLTLGILPAHLLAGESAVTLFDSAFNQRPVGAGPYRLETLTPDRAVLEANPAFHFGQPFIQRFELRFFRDDGALLGGLKARQVDAAVLQSVLSEADLLFLEERGDLRTWTLSTTETAYVFLNLRLPLFQDRRVRSALLYAIDRDAIVQAIFGGQAQRADSPITPASWAYSPTLRRYGHDARTAALLLDEAGWRLNAEGVRVKDGRQLAVRLSTANDPVRRAVAEAVAKAWSDLGVRAAVEPAGATSLVRDLFEPRAYEAAVFAQVSDADPDPYAAWHSSQAAGKNANLASLNDPRIDRVLEEARLVATQPRRKELYSEFQELFAQEVPAIPLYVTTVRYVQPAALGGVRNRLLDNPGARFWQVQEWHLKTR